MQPNNEAPANAPVNAPAEAPANVPVEAPAELRIVIVGDGRLARSILRTMPRRVVAAIVRNPAALDDFGAIVPGLKLAPSLREIDPNLYDVVWIVTADSAIATVAQELAPQREHWDGVAAIHSSGATLPSALEPLRERGGTVFALHPNASFTGHAPIPPGILWSISTNDATAMALAARLLDGVAPGIVVIEDAMRPLYHAAASVASNYSVTLFAMAEELFRRAGLSQADARAVVARFIADSAERAAAIGPGAALTGPIARGDMDVLGRQAAAVSRDAHEYLEPFQALARATAMLAGREITADTALQDDGDSSGTPAAHSGHDAAGKLSNGS